MPRSWRDRILLGALRAVPRPMAKHALFLMQANPTLADELGFHVRAIHYYDPLPDFRSITAEETAKRRIPPAIPFNLEEQRALLARLGRDYQGEFDELATRFRFANDYFAGFDAALYYALIRDLRPRQVIEIGAGVSTHLAAWALARNRSEGHAAELTCIEPFPQPRLTDRMPEVRLIQRPVEQVALEEFDRLRANDVLFLDSSHAVKFGGDVCRAFLEILPRLAAGVWVHVHDIFFPRDYPADWLVDRRLGFTEQYLLEAFLSFNAAYQVRAANFWLATEFASDVQRLLPPSLWPTIDQGRASFWMQRV